MIRAWRRPLALSGALGLALLLAACAGPALRSAPPPSAALAGQDLRERQLEAQPHWALQGRVAVRQGSDGGSGQLDWEVEPDLLQLSLRAPVSGQGWRLRVAPEGARLDGLESGPRQDQDADRLLREAVGWDLPLAQLTRWVRGMRGSPAAELSFDDAGLPSRMFDCGWVIDYRGWDRSMDPPLPRRIEAESAEHRIRLLVRAWQVGDVD